MRRPNIPFHAGVCSGLHPKSHPQAENIRQTVPQHLYELHPVSVVVYKVSLLHSEILQSGSLHHNPPAMRLLLSLKQLLLLLFPAHILPYGLYTHCC